MPAASPRALPRARRHPRSLLAAGSTALALAGSLAVAAPAAAAQSTSSIRVTPTSATFVQGTSTRLTAYLTSGTKALGSSGVRFYYKDAAHGTWTYLGTAVTSTNGASSIVRAMPRTFTFMATYAGSASYTAAQSTAGKLTMITKGQALVNEAARHKGAPYVWGATGPTTFDCSGYTLYVVRKVTGRTMSRTAQAQYTYSTRHISASSRQPGDLVFYRSSTGAITHVAIYAGGGYQWAQTKPGSYVKYQPVYSSNVLYGRPY